MSEMKLMFNIIMIYYSNHEHKLGKKKKLANVSLITSEMDIDFSITT